jgi:CRP-like cAMP-binding protein
MSDIATARPFDVRGRDSFGDVAMRTQHEVSPMIPPLGLPVDAPEAEADDDVWREGNRLLRLLSRTAPDDYAALLPLLTLVEQPRGSVSYEPGGPIPHVYFPETAVSSIVKIMADGRRLEVGTTGCEGMVGVPLFYGADASPFQCFVQVAGAAWRMDADAFRHVARHGTALHGLLQRYAQYLYDQAGQSVACGQLHTVDARCARWLLMTHDRVGRAGEFTLTHEYLATMLGVRRASVSVAAEELQRAGLIRYRRGHIAVVDREGLIAASCECYRSDREDYRRLLA